MKSRSQEVTHRAPHSNPHSLNDHEESKIAAGVELKDTFKTQTLTESTDQTNFSSLSKTNEAIAPKSTSKIDLNSIQQGDTIQRSWCPSCGNEAKLICTRCRSQKYCSKICQRNHWLSFHKQECRSIDGRIVIVDFQDENHSATVISHTLPTDKFVLKVQVALNSKSSPMIGYDYSRSIYYLISASNCNKSQLLDRTIRKTGDVMGSKAYFNAKILTRDNQLIIFLDQRHQNLGW